MGSPLHSTEIPRREGAPDAGGSDGTFLNDSPVFGPVRSRRFGLSLGVNLMPASGKICSFDCLYCENGFNADRATNEGHVPLERVSAELERTLARMAKEGTPPDQITFAGNGEPTLSPHFPAAIDVAVGLRDRYAPEARIGVLSNGTRADDPAVRAALLKTDAPTLKLDTVSQGYAEALDRPTGPYSVAHQIETYASYQGHVLIQTIFVRGTWQGHDFDNTSESYIEPWLDALARIRPMGVTVYTIARTTPAVGLEKAPAEALDAIADRVRALGIDCTVGY
jgi:wyosine [tRNA(Phe)-imidazoG37] synthetase (radical SAM superfamily)